MNDKTMSETIFTGYLPGAIGRIVELHANYYSLNWGFGLFFEARVAKEMSEFLIEVTSRMKSLEGLEVDLSVIFFPTEGDGLFHQPTAKTLTPNLR